MREKSLRDTFYYPQHLVQELEQAIALTANLLVIVVPNEDIGKAIKEMCLLESMQYIDISLALSRNLYFVSSQQCSQEAIEFFRHLSSKKEALPLFLDNLGILFDFSLELAPLKLLRELAKHRSVIAVWQGSVVDGIWLQYAKPNHQEYCREMIESNFTVVDCCYEI
jgi:hypothetical protein